LACDNRYFEIGH